MAASASGRGKAPRGTLRGAYRPDYRAFVENLNEIVFCLEADRRILFINPSVTRVTGYLPEELIGRRPDDFTHPDDLAATHRAIERALAGEMLTHEMRVYAKTGDIRSLRVSSRPLAGRGAHRTLVGVATDVTEHLLREEALRKSEARYRAMVEQQVECVCRWLPDTTLTFVNAGYCRFFERRPDELMGRRWLELVPESARASMTAIVADLVANPEVRSYEHEVVGGRGAVLWQEWTDCPIYDAAGRLVEFQSVGRDVTERRRSADALRRAEEQLRHAQKLEAVGILAGGIAHEFNNLLMGIGGYAHLVRERTRPNSQARRDVERVCGLVERGARLTRQILTFGRSRPVAFGPLDLNALLSNMTEMLKRVIGEDIDLQFEPGRGLPPIRGDLGQMEQVIMNLAVNARDAMPRGGRLRVSTQRGEIAEESASSGARVGPCVVLEVQDTGCGMDERTQRHIFEPFFTTKEVGKGAGLGLPLIYGIVRAHGGRISVDTAVGRGTTFRISLPVAPDPVPALSRRGALRRKAGNETVLIVDDDVPVRESLARVLKEAGYRVLRAATPDEAEAAAAILHGGIDLLLADVVLPERSGPELRESLVRTSPRLKALFLSGYPLEPGRTPWRVPVGFPVLTKPVSPDDLLRAVRAALGKG